MPPIDNGNYEVGRGKLPRHSQFRKGQSGNPKGRPPRSNSFGGSAIGSPPLNEIVRMNYALPSKAESLGV
jgi:hypothetical protein